MALTIEELLQRSRDELNAATLDYNRATAELTELRNASGPADEARVASIRTRQDAAGIRVRDLTATLAEIQREAADDDRLTRAAGDRTATGAAAPAARVTSEPRTYSENTDKSGRGFALDVARQFLFNDMRASDRLRRHMEEERVERGGDITERAVGTSGMTGLVVPQYLVDQFAPIARTGRPLADAMRHHDLPEQGMKVYIGKGTTGTRVARQVNEFDDVAEQDYDDELMEIPVQTAAGSQTLSRQAVERGAGVEETIIDDLVRGYFANLDDTLINQATTGLTNVATAIGYTDTTPTGAELYPRLLAAPSAIEATLLDQSLGNVIAVMHSRRWYWLQSQLTNQWPMFGQPGTAPQVAGLDYGTRYGAGFRGLLPSGTPVVLDNNIATNKGTGTNEDEIYFAAQSESHLWEDPNAPMLIRAEQSKAKKLAIDLVVYGYFAYTFERHPHAQKIAGTGLTVPTFV